MKWNPIIRKNPFARRDQNTDELFYQSPTYMPYLDLPASTALEKFYGRLLPAGGKILDLMAGCHSHLPKDISFQEVMGLGLNIDELKQNTQLTGYVIHDLNRENQLPFPDGHFDACILSLAVQYLVRPTDVFAEIARVLKSNGNFVVAFSDRTFPTKTVFTWFSKNYIQRSDLIRSIVCSTGLFNNITFENLSPDLKVSDPIYVIISRRNKIMTSNKKDKLNYDFVRRNFFLLVGSMLIMEITGCERLIDHEIGCNELTDNETEKKVREIIFEQLDIPKDKIQLDASFINDYNADSLDWVELVIAYEEAFNIEIPDHDAENLDTARAVISYIQKRMNNNNQNGKKKNGTCNEKSSKK